MFSFDVNLQLLRYISMLAVFISFFLLISIYYIEGSMSNHIQVFKRSHRRYVELAEKG